MSPASECLETGSAATAPSSTGAAPDRQYLNAADRLMLVAHDSMRAIGHGGFQCQTHVWLRDRVDPDALRAALASLNRRFPVVTSRLVDPGGNRPSYWRYRPEARVELHELTAGANDTATVWQRPEALFAEPLDLDETDPIAFHLLHLPDGRDVLVIRFGHALMDGKAPEFVLQAINQYHNGAGADESSPAPAGNDVPVDEMRAHLERHERSRRFKAAMQVVRGQIRLPVKPVTLDRPDLKGWAIRPYRIAVRSLNENQTAALTERATRLCGFANLSPVILAGVFRAVSRLTPRPQRGRTCFQTDVPLNLRRPGTSAPIFHNFMSFVQMSAMGSELSDRDGLARTLSARMRDQLRRGIDLGNLQMMAFMSRHVRLLRKHVMERAKKHPFTLGFGFQGPVVEGLETFCGRAVDWLYTLNSAMAPPGITLQINRFRDRLNLGLTYIEESVPESLAEAFLDAVIEDLLD
ncbi:MAG: hypothetical protein ACE5E1_00210 [Phycisphaerae bacterium]